MKKDCLQGRERELRGLEKKLYPTAAGCIARKDDGMMRVLFGSNDDRSKVMSVCSITSTTRLGYAPQLGLCNNYSTVANANGIRPAYYGLKTLILFTPSQSATQRYRPAASMPPWCIAIFNIESGSAGYGDVYTYTDCSHCKLAILNNLSDKEHASLRSNMEDTLCELDFSKPCGMILGIKVLNLLALLPRIKLSLGQITARLLSIYVFNEANLDPLHCWMVVNNMSCFAWRDIPLFKANDANTLHVECYLVDEGQFTDDSRVLGTVDISRAGYFLLYQRAGLLDSECRNLVQFKVDVRGSHDGLGAAEGNEWDSEAEYVSDEDEDAV
ncbi:hypothetical protein C8R44DRAFT_735620 [Mycena epipterygia]|nr:hypothetical protein C8R44DRAFT_735620 [Mycena epipterygia]